MQHTKICVRSTILPGRDQRGTHSVPTFTYGWQGEARSVTSLLADG